MVGIGENAGVVDIGDGYAVTFKVESHNHPSYVEPYQGAATGVGGIVRDILSMGARPVAVMDPLRFGPLDAEDTQRVLPGIVAGIGGYGNCLGLPNIGGEAVFDASYVGNPLVNALCVGVMRHEQLHLAKASGAGNQVILYGAKTGGDGIGGVSVLASETFDAEGPAKRPSVQVGDPFMEKLLIECTLELFAEDLVVGIQDLGGAGLSCATSELASAGDGGMHVWLDRVPLRDASLAPEEILMSESQERMMAVVEPGDVDRFLAICAKWDVDATVIGEVTEVTDEEASAAVGWSSSGTAGRSSTCLRGPSRTRAPSTSGRSRGRPGRTSSSPTTPRSLDRPKSGDELRETLLTMVGVAQPLRQVVDHRPVRPLRAGQHGARPAGGRRAGAGRRGDRARRRGRDRLQRPLREARPVRRRAARAGRGLPQRRAAGARPLAVTDCLNFGSPEDPDVMWQFAEAARGLADGCRELGIPVTGGNVSFYNQTGETAILPTPVVGVLGVIDDVTRRTPIGFPRRRAADLPARRRRATSSTARSGRTSCTATSVVFRRRSTWPPSTRSPTSSSTRRATA